MDVVRTWFVATMASRVTGVEKIPVKIRCAECR